MLGAVDVERARRRPPRLGDGLAAGPAEAGKTSVGTCRSGTRAGAALQLLFGEPLDVMAAGGDERVDQRVAVGRARRGPRS